MSISVLQMNGELNGLHVCHEAKTQAGWPKQVASLPLSRLTCLGKKRGVATTESFFTLGRVIPTDFVWLYNLKFINFVHVKVSFLFDVQILSV